MILSGKRVSTITQNSDSLHLICLQTGQVGLLFSRHRLHLLHTLTDLASNERHNGIVGIITISFGETFDGGLENLILDLLFVRTTQLLVYFSHSLVNDIIDVFVLVHVFISLGLFQHIDCSRMDVLL